MPAIQTRNKGKTLFVKEHLNIYPTSNSKRVNEAWTEAGMDGSISPTLVNKMRALLGLTGNIRGQGRKKKGKKSVARRAAAVSRQTQIFAEQANTSRRTNARSSSYFDVEADLDRLLVKIVNLGGLPKVEEAIREVRRSLYEAFVVSR